MRVEHLANLVSPVTGRSMRLQAVEEEAHGEVKQGRIVDESGSHIVNVENFIPRFATAQYTDSFGEQWNRYRSLQIDSENKLGISEERFYRWTGWDKKELRGLRILEAGCGAGRFTQVMLNAGAIVHSVDLSSAVDACWRTNGPHENLSLVQANIERIPFAPGSFDRVFCYGVLQHTPDPRKSFNCLVSFLRKGGKISIDSYIKSRLFTRWTSKYLWRPITTRISPTTLRKIVEYYVPKWLPVDTALSRIPVIGSALVGIIPCWNYTGMLPLEAEEILSWAILDTYDALASRYDKPQTLQAIHEWFSEAALSDVQVEVGSNGIVGNGCRV